MKKILLASALTLTLFATGCVSPKAVAAIDRGIAANKGHMTAADSPPGAKDVGQDNYDLLNQIKFNLCGTPIPEDTQARMDARAAKKAAEEKAKADAAAGGGE
jgi:hypothetical protein